MPETSIAQGAAEGPREPDPVADPVADLEVDLDALGRLTEELVDRHRDAGLEPGLAYGVVQGGRLVHAGGRGESYLGGPPPGIDTIFRIASMTKSFSAATVLSLRDVGKLRLDDEVARFVPEVAALRPPTDDAPPLTIRSLLTMTAGFPTDDPWGDRQQDLPDAAFARLIAGGLSFAWTPGTAWEYSNLGYALLGRVVSAASGQAYPDVVAERILDPLGLASTVFTADAVPADRLADGHRRIPGAGGEPLGWERLPFAGYGSFASMGGLFSTVRDLARWVAGLAAAFPPRPLGDTCDPHPLSRASRREMQFQHAGLPPLVTWRSVAEPPSVRGMGYGFGLVVERDPVLGTIVGHSGGYPGFGSHMRWHPATGLGVVVLGNATYAPVARLGTQLLDALLEPGRGPLANPGPRLPWPARVGASPAPATGSMAGATAAARADVERLLTRWDDALAARLFAMNVDLDEPLPIRAAKVQRVVAALGPLERDRETDVVSTSPAHCAWWMRGPRGRARVEIRLSPELPPRVQTFTVTAIPDPPAAHRRLADRVAALLGGLSGDGGAGRPVDLPLAPDLDVEALHRTLQAAAAWAGSSRVTAVVASDGRAEATYRLDGERCALHLTLSTDPITDVVTALTVVPVA